MDLTPYVTALRDDLAAAASVGDEQTARAGTALAGALEPAVRLALQNALSDLTGEISEKLDDRTVSLRLRGREVEVVVDRDGGDTTAAQEPGAGFFAGPSSSPFSGPGGPFRAPGFDAPGAAGRGADMGDISRMTLRLVDQIKGQAEQAAAAQGMSLNSWISQAVQGALHDNLRQKRRRWEGSWDPQRRSGESPEPPPAPDAGSGSDPRPGPTPAGLRSRRRGRLRGLRVGARMSTPDGSRRQERFTAAGPGELVVEIDAGRVDVRLDSPGAVTVEVVADREGAPGWVQGLAGLVDAAGGLERRFGFDLGAVAGLGVRRDESPEERAARAVAATEVTFADGTLHVRSPREVALRTIPLAVTVHAPDSSAVTVRAGAAPVDVAGRPGAVEVRTTGAVSFDRVAARSRVKCGAGDVTVGRVDGALRVTGGAGDVFLDEVHAGVEVVTGSGSVTAGRVAADLAVRCGSGDITVRDASAGELDLTTGAGSVRVGVHAGVDAAVDLRSAAGSASSDLPVTATRPEGDPSSGTVRIRGRAAAGDTRVVRAGA